MFPKSRNALLPLTAVLVLLSPAALAVDWGCHYDDSPSCPCFVDSGAWDPGGTWIQDVALATYGTKESCPLHADGGKPFYQMVLGIDDPDVADFAALTFDLWGCPYADADAPTGRQPWCTECICYWHHKAGIPYPAGFRNSDWFYSWQFKGTSGLVNYYKNEELLGGRGRWIDWNELDYDNFWPGYNAPCPGAYLPIQAWDGSAFTGGASGHSMMVNEMTVHVTPEGRVIRVEISIVEGNSDNRVRKDRVFDDVRKCTPGNTNVDNYQGPRFFMGWGIDLDRDGKPIYDPDRLHYVTDMVMAAELPEFETDTSMVLIEDPFWMKKLPELEQYARTARKTGPDVRSSPAVQASGIPDGVEQGWVFPAGLDEKAPEGTWVEIDLLEQYPLPVRGMLLTWRGNRMPDGYRVRWAGADRKYRDAQMPDLSKIEFPEQSEPFALPVPGMLSIDGKGWDVRYLRFEFPKGTFQGRTELTDLTLVFDTPAADAEVNQ